MVEFPDVILGISFALIAMICFSLAAVFQKKGIMEKAITLPISLLLTNQLA